LTAELDALLPIGQELDADQLAAVIDLCAWVHAEWVRIHPFANGNKRTSGQRFFVSVTHIRIAEHARFCSDSYTSCASQMLVTQPKPLRKKPSSKWMSAYASPAYDLDQGPIPGRPR
jgi:fido (protein-threonine AMPylation protein)